MEFLDILIILIRIEVIAIFVLPIVLGLLIRRGVMVTERQLAFSISILLSMIIFSNTIYYVYLWVPENSSSSPLKGWLVAITLSLITWLGSYLLCRWSYRQLFQR